MVYKNENGSIKDYEMNKKSMKIMSAVKLIEELPETFEPVKQKLLNDMSNAFFDPEIQYENVVKEAEDEAACRGLTVIFSETKIKQQSTIPQHQNPKKIHKKDGRKAILEYIKENNDAKGTVTENKVKWEIISKSKLCMYCLTKTCRQEQFKTRQKAKCNERLYELDDPALMQLLETKEMEKQIPILTNKKSNKAAPAQPEIEIPTPPIAEVDTTHPKENTEIKPEERFKEIIEEDDEPTDMDHFLQLMKEQGIQTLQERGIKTIKSTSIIKRNYIMEPEVLPYQDILDTKPKIAAKELEFTPKKDNPSKEKKVNYVIPIYEVGDKVKLEKSFEDNTEEVNALINQETKNSSYPQKPKLKTTNHGLNYEIEGRTTRHKAEKKHPKADQVRRSNRIRPTILENIYKARKKSHK